MDLAPQDAASYPRAAAPLGTGGDVARLAFDGIGFRVGGRAILDAVSLCVEAGRTLCLLGPSGSGKTSLLRIAAGIERQTEGLLSIDGRLVAGPGLFVAPEHRGVGLMFQDFALFPHMTILQNVLFGLAQRAGTEARRAAGEALERVGLSAAASAYPHALSGGEQQRVALARALVPRPSVLLMDEPFSGLDSRLKDTVRDDTLDILRANGATAVVVTHDAEEAMRMGDRIALLRDGRLVQSGTARDLYERPVDLFAAGFFSELNIFDGIVRGGRVTTAFGPVASSPRSDGTRVTVALRPTGLSLCEGPSGTAARLLERRYLGGTELLTLSVAGIDRPLRARVRRGRTAESGEELFLSVDLQDVMVFERADRHT